MAFNFAILSLPIILLAVTPRIGAATTEQKVFHLGAEKQLQLRFIRIPSGTVVMGDIDGQQDERPRIKVSISSFYMQDSELSLGLYKEYAKTIVESPKAGCEVFRSEWTYLDHVTWRNPGYKQTSTHPVVCVSWDQVQKFTVWLSNQLSETFRLPTESEWEYAARARSLHRYYWGQDPKGLCQHSNASDRQTLKRFPTFKSNDCDDGYLETAPIKSFKSNSYGLYDVYGNVWEWVQDCWSPDYTQLPTDGKAFESADCRRKGFRGGGWGDNPNFARSGLRNRGNKNRGKDDVGFRLVWVPKKNV